MHAYVELCRLPSNQLEVACISGKAVGLLFGRFNAGYTTTDKLRALFPYLALGVRAVLGQYGRLSMPLTLLRKSIITSAQVKKHMPEADAIVQWFVVDAKHRGKGIGTALMDRFVGGAKNRGAQRIALHTDQLSTWQFYEKYGFTRWSTFTEVFSSYLKGEEVKGFIYTLDIAKSTVVLEQRQDYEPTTRADR
ncbi:MAG: GNAT family N-acetyltransferase [Anaerolineae bacterium]|nr:GNAT family N-acetyltransferase [Anaerolineae bacterium]